MKIYVVGIGPGKEDMMTVRALNVLDECDVIIGYTTYLKLLTDRFESKELLSTPMGKEEERCRLAFDKAKEGKKTAIICSGDAGIYGMASLMYEIGRDEKDMEIEVVPGVSALSSGAALLGAPINNDFCVISLSDYLNTWDMITKRLKAAAEADFAIVLYNPSSSKRKDYLQKACDILLETLKPDTCCGIATDIGREGESITLLSLEELRNAETNMFSTVFITNSTGDIINGNLITKRGYPSEVNRGK